ncbi:hypothetical protein EXW96_10500 [Paenibacillus sp. JMULE4]|nr:hypothetical protein [Paenibacillus sp. JMULE4]
MDAVPSKICSKPTGGFLQKPTFWRPAQSFGQWIRGGKQVEKDMNKRFSLEEKTRLLWNAWQEDKTIKELASELGVRPEQIARWKRDICDQLKKSMDNAGCETNEQTDAEKLTAQLEWLKKALASHLSRKERAELIDRSPDALPLSTQTRLLGLNRSSLYYRPVPRKELIKKRVAEVQSLYPYWGSRRIAKALQREGLNANRSTIQRYMQETAPEISVTTTAPGQDKRSLEYSLYAYLNQRANQSSANEILEMDIPAVRMQYGWMDIYGGYH